MQQQQQQQQQTSSPLFLAWFASLNLLLSPLPSFLLLTYLVHYYFSLVVHDVTEPIQLEVDEIYHLACPASPPHYQYNPVKTIKTSTMGTLNMLGLAKRVHAKILLTSTSEIYGDPKVHPQPESYWGNVNTIGPRSCYDEGKRVAETMMYSYKKALAELFHTFIKIQFQITGIHKNYKNSFLEGEK